jgi:hypothetical protein
MREAEFYNSGGGVHEAGYRADMSPYKRAYGIVIEPGIPLQVLTPGHLAAKRYACLFLSMWRIYMRS